MVAPKPATPDAASAKREPEPNLGELSDAEQAAADVSEIVALLDHIVETENISLEQFALDHQLARALLFRWRKSGGKPVPRLLSPAKVLMIERAVRQRARELKLVN